MALFRLLRTSTDDTAVAWLLAWIAMMSLRHGVQLSVYPEVAAGLALTLLIGYASRPTLVSGRSAFLYGVLAGFLPWLHLRFGPAALLVALAVCWHRSRPTRAALEFVCGLVVPLAALALYGYYISGSLLPWALYSVIPDSPGFSATRVLDDLPRFWFDSQRGLVANAPIYLFALPGILLFWRRRPRQSLLVAGVIGSVAVLSAAHGWGGGDSTPLRLVAAVIPFLFLPIADALRAARTSRWRIAAFVMLAVYSVQNGLTYNRYFLKASQYFLMSGPSVSGWKMSLLLPATDGSSYALSPIFALWAAMTLALVAAPLWLPRAGRLTSIDAEGRGHLSGFVVASLVVVILLAVTGSTVGVPWERLRIPTSCRIRARSATSC